MDPGASAETYRRREPEKSRSTRSSPGIWDPVPSKPGRPSTDCLRGEWVSEVLAVPLRVVGRWYRGQARRERHPDEPQRAGFYAPLDRGTPCYIVSSLTPGLHIRCPCATFPGANDAGSEKDGGRAARRPQGRSELVVSGERGGSSLNAGHR